MAGAAAAVGGRVTVLLMVLPAVRVVSAAQVPKDARPSHHWLPGVD